MKQFLLLSRQRPGLVAQCLRDSESSKPSFMPRLYINRRLAMEHRACPLRDPACKNAVFTQVWSPGCHLGSEQGRVSRGTRGHWARRDLSKVFGQEWGRTFPQLPPLLPGPRFTKASSPLTSMKSPWTTGMAWGQGTCSGHTWTHSTHTLPLDPSALPLCSPYSWVDPGLVGHPEP